MFVRFFWVSSVFVLHLLAFGTQPAPAQGFFQSLFGGGQARPMRPRRVMPLHGRYSHFGSQSPWWYSERQSRPQRSRHYTAMCVRMCDGYYYPISNRASRHKLHDLAQRCEQTCSGEAKLFYMPAQEADVARMTDLSGRAYEHLDTAFLYRKKLVKSCTCKPMPWSYAARSRHHSYAVKAAELRHRKQLAAQREAVDRKRKNAETKRHRTTVAHLDDTGDDEAVTADSDEKNIAAQARINNLVEPEADEMDTHVRQPTRSPRKVSRHRSARQATRKRIRRHKPNPSWGTGFGGSGNKYVWPGDRRRRR